MNQQNPNLINWLLSTGLDEQRARMYLAALSSGQASAKELAEKMKMNRTAIYDNIRVLEERGYITTIHEGNKKLFVPLHPKELYKRFQAQKEQLKDLLPDFLATYAETGNQPFVQMYTGKYAARNIYEDILTTAKEEYLYLSPSSLTYQNLDKAYITKWIDRRMKKNLASRSLRVKGKEMHDELFNKEKEYNRQIRFLPTYVDLKSTIYIYENNIGIISTAAEGSAFIIHSPDLSFSFRQIFNFLWSVSMKS